MLRLPGLSLALTLVLGACHEATTPTTYTYNAGTWMSAAIPSGAYTEFSLDTVRGVVRGNGRDYGLMSRPVDTFTITGRVVNPSITLSFVYSSGGTATYAAQFVSMAQMTGTLAVAGQSPRESVSFFLEDVTTSAPQVRPVR